VNGIANFVASLVVDCHVVLFATMLLDLRHFSCSLLPLTCQSLVR
jgi:hypothetical protein